VATRPEKGRTRPRATFLARPARLLYALGGNFTRLARIDLRRNRSINDSAKSSQILASKSRSVHDRTAACPQIAHASASSERSGFDRHVERSGRSGKIERRFFVRLEQSPFRTGGVTLLIVPIAARSFCDGWLPQEDLPQPPEGR
jgi:hypothetical protein